ncbi:hypothetical protein GCM10007231_11450 [Nocardioides daphniae]|uniref:Uncharacterized protein n=1 Tax=Nocardioides daphniae TaxID=402297 RepID=A0ABQ1Q608_9ACTN|nr:hypothetical protein GCM10007231_11450 [Nocardioides daphniae]
MPGLLGHPHRERVVVGTGNGGDLGVSALCAHPRQPTQPTGRRRADEHAGSVGIARPGYARSDLGPVVPENRPNTPMTHVEYLSLGRSNWHGREIVIYLIGYKPLSSRGIIESHR